MASEVVSESVSFLPYWERVIKVNSCNSYSYSYETCATKGALGGLVGSS